uniref:Uncharacterized protein n=1 Tax=Panagrolaimus sp. JU765 TaxID=591449 RepID=A0AC34PWB7_9BILA
MKEPLESDGMEKMDIDDKLVKVEDDDEVVAEMDCYHLPLNRQHFSAATLQFNSEQAAKMEDCSARIKPIVKHLEVDYQDGTDRDDGMNTDSSSVTFAGKATSESEVLNHALCFVKDSKLYFVEVDDHYKMRRKITKPNDETVEDSEDVKRSLSPVRVKFARAETEAQRKRREQSSFFKTQQAAQESWKSVPVIHEEPSYPLEILSRQKEEDLLPRNGNQVKNEVIDC